MNDRAAVARLAPALEPVQVLAVASEMFPLLKTGGLADVVGALPAARKLCQWPAWFGGPARLLAARQGSADSLVLDAPHLYARHGNPYVDANDAALKAGAATGVQFSEITAQGLLDAVHKTLPLYRRPEVWRRLQQAGMRAEVGWHSSAVAYAALYRSLVHAKVLT